jgi:hypothetical protein
MIREFISIERDSSVRRGGAPQVRTLSGMWGRRLHGDWRNTLCIHSLRSGGGRRPRLPLGCWRVRFHSFRPTGGRIATSGETVWRSKRGTPGDCKKYDKPGRNVKRGKDGATLSLGIAVTIQRTPTRSRRGEGGRVTTFPNPRRGPCCHGRSRSVSRSFLLMGVVAGLARPSKLPERRLGRAEVFLFG